LLCCFASDRDEEADTDGLAADGDEVRQALPRQISRVPDRSRVALKLKGLVHDVAEDQPTERIRLHSRLCRRFN